MIYMHAANTVIWLDNDGELELALAFKTLQDVHTRLQLAEQKITPNRLPELVLPTEKDPAWRAIRQLFRKKWFSRTWTIQEARLSKRLFFQCGRTVSHWDDVALGCVTLRYTGLHDWLVTGSGDDEMNLAQPSGGTAINMIEDERTQGPVSQSHGHLLRTLVDTRYAEATDLRDKVYGVLGLVVTDIIPDYSRENSYRDVYHSTCLSQMSVRAHKVLTCVDHDNPLRPSWVPDWSSPRVTEPLAYLTKTWPLYYAGGKQEPGKLSYGQAVISQDTKLATFSGKVFDQIATLGHICQDPDLHADDPASKNKDLAESSPSSTPQSQQSITHTLQNTCTMPSCKLSSPAATAAAKPHQRPTTATSLAYFSTRPRPACLRSPANHTARAAKKGISRSKV
jgi:hypothetical protein